MINKNIFKPYVEIKSSNRPIHIPTMAAMAIGIPAAVATYFGNIQMGITACFGGLVILYYQMSLPFAARMLKMLTCSFGFLISYLIGITFSFNIYTAAVAIGIYSIAVHWLSKKLKLAPPGYFFFIMIASTAGYNAIDFNAIPTKLGFLALGTIFATTLALVHALLTYKREETHTSINLELGKGEMVTTVESLIVGFSIFSSILIGYYLKLDNPYWVPISCLAVMQGASSSHIWERAIQRLLGTSLGILLCWLILNISSSSWTIVIALFFLQFIVELLIVRNYALAVIFITPLTIILADVGAEIQAPTDTLMLSRWLDICIGSLVGAVGGWLIYHQKLKEHLAKKLAKAKGSLVRK